MSILSQGAIIFQTPVGISAPIYFSTLSAADKASATSGINIEKGVTLVIDEMIDFDNGAGIWVFNGNGPAQILAPPYNAGAVLIIQERLTCSNGTWLGVKVYGNELDPHFDVVPDESLLNDVGAYMGIRNEYHGFVDIQTGAIIENADQGVWSLDGGIVQSFVGPFAGKPQFVNCQEGLYVENSIQSPSATRLNSCDFSWTDPNIHGQSQYTGFTHVSIDNSKDIRLGGCKIVGEWNQGNKYGTDEKGIGVEIKGIQSTYSLGEAGNTYQLNPNGCTAIKYYSDPNTAHKSVVAHLSNGVFSSGFDKGAVNNTVFAANITCANLIGGFVDFHDNFFKADDQFMLQHYSHAPGGGIPLAKRFISFDGDKASIYKNHFEFHNSSGAHWGLDAMIVIIAGGDDITFRNNDFYGDMDNTIPTPKAIVGFGDLTNLEWTCNTFNDFETAVFYNGTGPGQNPQSAGYTAGNSYNNITGIKINNASSQQLTYLGPNQNPSNNVIFDPNTGEENPCVFSCSGMEVKNKVSFTGKKIEQDGEDEMEESPLAFDTDMVLYPNPAEDKITVRTTERGDKSITICNSLGKKVYIINITENSTTITLDDFEAGVYFLTLDTKDGRTTRRFIIAR